MSSTEEFNATFEPQLVIIIAFKQENTAGDIQGYIEAWLQYNKDMRDLPVALKKDIKSTLVKGADGMYSVTCRNFGSYETDRGLGFDGYNVN